MIGRYWRGVLGHRLALIVHLAGFFLIFDFSVKSIDRFVRPPSPPQVHLSIRIPDPDSDHGVRPYSSGFERYGSQSAEYFSNSLGLRDEKIREVPLVSRDYRILFMGDSMTEAAMLPWEKTFVGHLQAQLRGKTEILNGAIEDFGPTLILPKLQNLLSKKGVRVDQVVVVLSPSALRTVFTYVKNKNGKIERLRYGPYQDLAPFLSRTDKLESWLEVNVEKKFVLLGALVRNLRLTWRKIHPDTRAADRLKTWVAEGCSNLPEEQDLILEGTRRTLDSLDQIHEFLDSRNVALCVVFLPGPKALLSFPHASPLTDRLAVWAKDRGVNYIDLRPYFLGEGTPGEVVARDYLKNDDHLSEAGHQLVATWLADPRNGLFPVRRQIPPK
jgi:hypothetical protein